MRAALLLLALAATAAAQTVPPLTGRVVDTAEMLSPATEAAITARLAAFEDSTSTQVAVLTVPSLDGGNLEAFATTVFRTWGLGQADRDNGVLLLVARDDRKLRIEVGYGLEGDLTDARASEIIRTVIVPRLRDSDPDAAVSAGVDAILASVAGTYRADVGFREAPARARPYVTPNPPSGTLLAGFALFMLLRWLSVSTGDKTLMGCGGSFLGLLVAAGVVLATGNLFLIVLAVLVPLAAVGLDTLLEWYPRTSRWRMLRRRASSIKVARRRRHETLFAAARSSGKKRVVIDGVERRVPKLIGSSSSGSGGSSGGSSSSSFSGGGGSSGGGGASGSW